MKATLEQIGQLGWQEKEAMREQYPLDQDDANDYAAMAFLQGVFWERSRGDREAVEALRAVLQGMRDHQVSGPYRDTLDKARDLLAKRLEAK